jgi:MFS family permease
VYEVLVQSFRQAVVPDELMGRVLAAFRLIGLGVIPLGGVLGGLVGRAAGVRAPFLVGAGIMAVVAVLALRVVTNAEVRAARGDIEAGTADPAGPERCDREAGTEAR